MICKVLFVSFVKFYFYDRMARAYSRGADNIDFIPDARSGH